MLYIRDSVSGTAARMFLRMRMRRTHVSCCITRSSSASAKCIIINALVDDELTGFHFRNGCPFVPFGPFLNLRLLLPVPVS